jgi:predicted nucleic acid-binding protein
MAYLVDTGVMVDFTRGNGKAADYLDSFGGACLLCAMTTLELNCRCAQPAGPHDDLRELPWLAGARLPDRRDRLEEGLTLATRDRTHFRMIGDLKLEVPGY